jgi:hypothetical protein
VRTIKTLGIATAMALALIAFVGAASASANNFKVNAEPAKWSGSVSGKSHELSLNGESFTCNNVVFSGETVNKTINEVTVAPELNGCVHNGFPATWAMHGCKFRLRPGAGPALVGSLDIVGCVTPMSNESSGCLTEIGNQSGLGTVTYKNVATSPATITAIASINSLTFTRSGSCSGPKGTFSNGTYSGEWTIKGATTPGGVPAAVEIESTPAPPLSKFVAEEAPVTLSGIGGNGVLPTFTFTTNGPISNGTIYCESRTYSGTISTVSAEAIALAPVHHNCSINFNGGPKTKVPDESITAGGCSYEVQAKGGFAIVGASCAANPISITIPGCVLTMGPQGGFVGRFTFINEGSGKLRTVKIDQPDSGLPRLTYTAVGPGCVKQGTFVAEATVRMVPVLSATNSNGAAQGFWVE